jgi:hypothetical protein
VEKGDWLDNLLEWLAEGKTGKVIEFLWKWVIGPIVGFAILVAMLLYVWYLIQIPPFYE